MAGQAQKKNHQNMLYWKEIMEYLLASVYAIYIISLIVTWMFYPAGPIYDLETDEIIGERYGVTWWNFAMLAFFTMVNRWGYMMINSQNEQGITPGFCLDVFGFNILIMVAYCFTSSALKLFWLIPIYAVYKIWITVGPYLKMICPSIFGRSAMYDQFDSNGAEDDGKSNTQKKKEKRE